MLLPFALTIITASTSFGDVQAARVRKLEQESVKSVAQTELALAGDLRKLHKSYYASYNVGKTSAWNARHAFRHFVELATFKSQHHELKEHYKTGESIEENIDDAFWENIGTNKEASEVLTADELVNFEERVLEDLEGQVAHSHLQELASTEERDTIWGAAVGKALHEQKPLVTEDMVSKINQKNLGWEARAYPELQKMSMNDGLGMTGLPVDPAGKDESDVQDEPPSLSNSSFVQFQAHTKWPECAGVLGHIRAQGTCGSCWANSAAYVLESRLCIATEGGFSGPMAWISAEYAASCTASIGFFGFKLLTLDGCQGGHASWAFDHIQKKGIPTGGPGCIPYQINGNSLAHFESKQETPECPKECTNKDYSRKLEDDTYKMRFKHYAFGDHEKAKREMAERGPIVFDFEVHRDFFAYSSGIYKPMLTKDTAGYHSTACFGYGPDYLFCKNSWGRMWGDWGNFKIDPKPVLMRNGYRAVGDIDLANSYLPEVQKGNTWGDRWSRIKHGFWKRL